MLTLKPNTTPVMILRTILNEVTFQWNTKSIQLVLKLWNIAITIMESPRSLNCSIKHKIMMNSSGDPNSIKIYSILKANSFSPST